MNLNKKFKKDVESNLMYLISEHSSKQMRDMLKGSLFPGRRIRPILFLSLMSKQSAFNLERDLIEIATAIELVHRSSIIQDDLIDSDTMRRKLPTFYVVYGEDVTILISHYLIYKVYNIIESLQKKVSDIEALFTHTYGSMVIGELADIWKIKVDSNFELFYRQVILKKSSALFRLIFDLTSVLINLSDKERIFFSDIGESTGALYQMYNDIYDDIFRDPDERGSGLFSRVTLSLLPSIVLDSGEKSHRNLVLEVLNNGYSERHKELSLENFLKLRKIFQLPEYKNIAFKTADSLWNNTLDKISILKYPQHRKVLFLFLKEIRKKAWWNHDNFKSVGYS